MFSSNFSVMNLGWFGEINLVRGWGVMENVNSACENEEHILYGFWLNRGLKSLMAGLVDW